MPISDRTIQNLINNHSISELLGLPQDYEVKASDFNPIKDTLWEKYKNEIRNDPQRIVENQEESYSYDTSQSGRKTATIRKVSFNGNIMRFTVSKKGAKPTNGYPLVISLHGGGSTSEADNNQQWANQQTIWGGQFSPGIYVTPRAITNAWNMHFVADAYPLYDRLIENMIAFEDADPDKIMIMGFSAGGDGIYQITPRMADRFCATNMMAGHPNGVSVKNYMNVPFLIEMGENDSSYNRNREAARYDQLLDVQRSSNPGGYLHDTFILPGGNHNNWIPKSVMGGSSQPTAVIKDPEKWLASGDQSTVNKNTESIPWMNKYTRDGTPVKVIFDSTTRADRRTGLVPSTGDRLWLSQNRAYQFYWLNIGGNPADYGEVVASTEKNQNRINITAMGKALRLLLHPDMLNLNSEVEVNVKGQSSRVKPIWSFKTMVRTLVDHGDKKMIFPANLFVVQNGSNYDVISGSSIQFTSPVGGSGTAFEDHPSSEAKLTKVIVRSGDIIDSIQAFYGSDAMPLHGGQGGGAHEINFDNDEYITRMYGKSGYWFGATHITQLSLVTNKRTYGPYGSGRFSSGQQNFSIDAPANMSIVAFNGRTFRHSNGDNYLSAIGAGFSLRTKNAETFDGSGSGMPIPPQGTSGVARFFATVTLNRPVADINVFLDLDHSYTGDLKIELISPQGTTVVLSGQRGGGGDNYDNTIFDDQASTSISQAQAPFTGSFKPDEPLSAFQGENPSGKWVLQVSDNATGDIGVMHSWKLYVSTY